MKRSFLKILLMLSLFTCLCLASSVSFASTKIDIPEYIRVKLNDGSIERIELDTYLYSVVQSEMGLYYKASGMKSAERVPLEALKAQAVASRSYAVYNILNASHVADYDVTSTTSSQVYKSNANIDSLVKKAVDETSGQVITYDDEVACAYFFSTSGGYTESSENVWYAALPYLRGVEDEYEIEVDNNSFWTARYTVAEIEGKFPEIGNLKNVKIVEKSENGRVIELKISGSDASKILLKNGIRTSLGASKLKSQWFKVELDDDEIIFTGKGYGHGVGMSQNGAIGMALEGFTYDEILEWYYTDIEIYGFSGTTKRGNSSTKNDDKKNQNTDDESEEKEEEIVIEEEKPMLEKLTAFCTTNWMLKML
ncbi:MAG: SpoIID/LytB domain-containing protein [Clostridia bacterium]|nr:SpoIID/LytB domain-containing protein [Clostridia bacterium]